MSQYRFICRSLATALTILILLPLAMYARPVNTGEAVQNIQYYFDLLISNNIESARGLWTESVIERSGRFGIEYEGVPIKLDCASPVVLDMPALRDQLYRSIRQVSGLDDDHTYFTGKYEGLVNGEKVSHLYYTYYDGEYFWLTHAQDYFCRDWPIIESKYFRIRCHPDRQAYLNPVTLAEADRFVRVMAESLGMKRSDLRQFQEKKIEYFFCPSDSLIKEITGHRIRGMFDLPTNDIISAYFPHFHEVAHLLINAHLKKLPLHTQPFLREGLAVYLGGRWGKSPGTLDYLAGFLQDQQLVEVDSIITLERFNQMATADMSYPVAGLFTAFVIDKVGMEKFLQLYRSLSGTYKVLAQMDEKTIHDQFVKTLGKPDWLQVMLSYERFVIKQLGEKSSFAPGGIERGKTLLKENNLIVTEDRKWISVQVAGDGEKPPAGDLLFGFDKELEGQRSLLHDEQHQESQPLKGYRYCIRFDANEAGLYDFVTNQLLGKYIFGLTPSDDYFSDDGGTIVVKFRKELSGKTTPREGDFELILK